MPQTQTPAVFIQSGTAIPDPSTTTRYPGDVVNLGTIPLPVRPTDPNQTGANTFDMDGVWDVPKTTDTFTAGDAVYWNSTGSPVVGTVSTGAATSSTGNLMGLAIKDAATGDTYVRVKLTAAKRTTTIAGSVTADDITGSDSSLAVAGKQGNASAGGIVAVAGGAAAAGAYDGGAVTVAGGAGPTAGNTGGAVTILSGAGDVSNGTAGAILIDSGAGATKGAITIGTNAASITLGKSPRIPFVSVNANGGNIATAGALSEGVNLVLLSDNSKGVQLPSCVNGALCVVINMVTDKTLLIYPPTGKQVNLRGANNSLNVAANTVGIFYSEGVNAWYGLDAATDVA
jgi:hypothetical protein